jgi:lysine 6-dehydrogenase
VRACVLGAGGTIGPAIARDLASSDEVAELLLLDLDAGRAAGVVEGIGDRGVRAAAADARDAAALAAAIQGFDVLVNSASYRLNLSVMEACLRAGAHYMDLGGLYHVTAEQFEAFAPAGGDDRFGSEGLLAVLGIGSSPGKTNLMAVQAARELGGSVDALNVSAAGRDMSPPPGFSVPYALQTLIDELTLAPVVIRDGERVEIEPLEPGGAVDFGEPIGESETIHTLHSEMLTFGDSFGCREASFRLSLHEDLLDRLRELAGASPEAIAAAARDAAPPSSDTVSVHLIEAAGGGRFVRVRAVTRPVEDLGVGGGVASTAAPAAAAVRLLARGDLTTRGVHPPERCIDPDALFAELRLRGCEFDVAVSDAEGVASN